MDISQGRRLIRDVMQDVVEQDDVDASRVKFRQIACGDRHEVVEPQPGRRPPDRPERQRMDVERVDAAFGPDQASGRRRKASGSATEVQDNHAGVKTRFLEYRERRPDQVAQSELQRHQAKRKIAF
jgi:hypothetical protein